MNPFAKLIWFALITVAACFARPADAAQLPKHPGTIEWGPGAGGGYGPQATAIERRGGELACCLPKHVGTIE